MTSDMVGMHFDPNLPVTILIDASRLHGLGYAMGHFVDGRFKIVAYGSKSLTQHSNVMLRSSLSVWGFTSLWTSVPFI